MTYRASDAILGLGNSGGEAMTTPTELNDVMMEQLQYLENIAGEHGMCACSACQRYARVRTVLLEIFAKPANAPCTPTVLAKAA
jgi:hypothetical protein